MQKPNESRITQPLPHEVEFDFLIGTLLSERYLIESIIGRGSMGVVYKAMHTVIGRPVAIKTLNSRFVSEERSFKRFTREARATSRLSHPNIITVHDAGFTPNGLPYLVMDYIEGITLADAIKSGKRPGLAKSIDIAIQVCAALAHAHEQRIIHRDLKPSNIMLVRHSSGNDLVKVVDFGIAKMAYADEDGNIVTRTGEVVGTPVYMSPEQAIAMPLDERSDIYSFGVVLYELLTGSPPFKGNNPAETIRKHLVEAAPAFQASGVTNVSRELEKVVFRCLSKRPDDRYASMHELRLELEGHRLHASGQAIAQNVPSRKTPPIALPEETTEEFRMFLQEKMRPVIDPIPEDSTEALRKLVRQRVLQSETGDKAKSQAGDRRSKEQLQNSTTASVQATRKPNELYVKLAVASAVFALALTATAWLWTAVRQPEDTKPQADIRGANYGAITSDTIDNAQDNYSDTVINTKMAGDRQSKIESSTQIKAISMQPLHAPALLQKSPDHPHSSSLLRKTSDIEHPSVPAIRASRMIVPKSVTTNSIKTTQQRGTDREVVTEPHLQQQVSGEAPVLPQSNEESAPKVAIQSTIATPSENVSHMVPTLRNNRDNIVQLNNDGLEAMHARNFSKAIQKFETALRLDPAYSKARHNLLSTYNNYAIMLHRAGQLAMAERFYRKALALHSGSPGGRPLLQNYAALLRATNRNEEAEKIEVQVSR